MGRKLASLGCRGLLMLVGGVAALAGSSCSTEGPLPPYGMPPPWDAGPGFDASLGTADAAYGPPTCTTDAPCKNLGSDWYCDQATGTCVPGEPDAGKDGG